jgi:predicted transcriptional regulator
MNLLKVADQMNHHPVTFQADMTLEAAVDKLTDARQLGGPVIDKNRKVIGFLSEQDCLARMLLSSYHDQVSAHVFDVMRTEVLTVKPYTGIIDLAQQMLGAKPKIYPVVDDNGILVGVITRTDVLRAIDQELHSHYRAVS